MQTNTADFDTIVPWIRGGLVGVHAGGPASVLAGVRAAGQAASQAAGQAAGQAADQAADQAGSGRPASQAGSVGPYLLAFDTSTEVLALACTGPRGAFTLHGEGGARASAQLLPQARRLLAHAGLGLADLHGLGFGSGPGAFTGLRTACAVAQGLGLGLALPVLPVSSLLLVAEDARRQLSTLAFGARGIKTSLPAAPDQPLDIAVAMDARMDEAYVARFVWADAQWQTVAEPALMSLPNLLLAWSGLPLPVCAGSALTAFGPRLKLPPKAVQIPHEMNRAGALLELVLDAHAHGMGVDAAQALPVYLRNKVAQTTAERAQLQALRNEQGAGLAQGKPSVQP